MASRSELTLCAALFLLCCPSRVFAEEKCHWHWLRPQRLRSSRQPRGPFEIPRPRLLAPHSRNSQLQQSLPQGHSRTNLLKQTDARDRASFAGRFPTSLSSPSHCYSSPAKITAHCPEQTPCA